MSLTKLVAGTKGDVNNSNGADVANAVNALIAVTGSYQRNVVGFGDSITAFTNSFVHWLVRSSGGKYVYYGNYGVAGNTTQNMLDRIDDIPTGAQVVTVMETANDANNSVTPSDHAANMREILTTLQGRGLDVIFFLGNPSDTDAHAALVFEYNVYDYFTCKELGITCLDVWSQFSDVSDGGWVASNTTDGTHPTNAAEKIAGVSAYNDLVEFNYSSLITRDDSRGLLNNNCFLQTFDDRPSFWVLVGTPVRSTSSQPSFALGNTYECKATSGDVYLYRAGLSVTAGDTYVISGVCEALINSGEPTISLYGSYGSGGARHYSIQDSTQDIERQEFYLEFTATQTTTDFRIYWLARSGASYDVDMKLAQVQMYNKSDYVI